MRILLPVSVVQKLWPNSHWRLKAKRRGLWFFEWPAASWRFISGGAWTMSRWAPWTRSAGRRRRRRRAVKAGCPAGDGFWSVEASLDDVSFLVFNVEQVMKIRVMQEWWFVGFFGIQMSRCIHLFCFVLCTVKLLTFLRWLAHAPSTPPRWKQHLKCSSSEVAQQLLGGLPTKSSAFD